MTAPQPMSSLSPSMPVLATLLRDVELFRSLPATSLKCVEALRNGDIRVFAAGATVLAVSEVPSLVVVLAGRLGNGAMHTRRNEVAALPWAIARLPLPADVVAEVDSTAYVLAPDALEAALLACPALCADVARELAAGCIDAMQRSTPDPSYRTSFP